uniref:Uncharacterized protein n=1 Tax=Angiostrongylus cantonensis TaxID=6313 RepID=A0A0K0DQQ7_ANGCA
MDPGKCRKNVALRHMDGLELDEQSEWLPGFIMKTKAIHATCLSTISAHNAELESLSKAHRDQVSYISGN